MTMLYHYAATEAAGRRISREGVIRALPMLLYEDLLATRPVLLEPVVWLTAADRLSPTVAAKAELDGVLPSQPLAFMRVLVPDPGGGLPDLPAWAYSHGHEPELFTFMLLTARMAGEDYLDWRLADGDVPRSRWAGVEYLLDGRWVRL